MKKKGSIRVIAAIAVILTASVFTIEAQGLRGLGNRVKEKATEAVKKEAGIEEKTTTSSSSSGGGNVSAGARDEVAKLPKTTFKGEDKTPAQPWEIASERSLDTGIGRMGNRIIKGSVTATFADGVLTISGPGQMDNFGDTNPRPWGSIKDQITKVVLSPEVYNIGESAFVGCTNLKEITFSKELQDLGAGAFAGCTSLETITIPKTVTQPLRASSGNADPFENCTSLKEIKVESGNENLTAVDGVLFNTRKTTLLCYPAGKQGASYTVPEGVDQINDKAFAHNAAITDVTLAKSTKNLRARAFYACPSLQSVTVQNMDQYPISVSHETFISIDLGNFKFYVPAEKLDDYKNNDSTGLRRIAKNITTK